LATLLSLPDAQRAQLERELVQFARAAALGELAADIAHDLANPLFGVVGLVDLLLADATPQSEAESRLQMLRRTAVELKDTLHVLLQRAAASEEQSAPASLDTAARAAAGMLRYGTGRLEPPIERYPAEPVLVPVPSDALVQAITHVLLAARRHGRVSIEVDGRELRVSPAPDDSLGVLVATRIIADYGGTVERDADTIRFRWVG
jgi:signal transduction histidine kinase